MTSRIICVGNQYVPGDDTGPRVYHCLAQMRLPERVEVIDGGLAGLNLLRFVEGAERVVFVDSVVGFGPPGEVVVLSGEEIVPGGNTGYGHNSGVAYLLQVLPSVCEGPSPELMMVGAEGPVENRTIQALARASLNLARGVEVKEDEK